MKPTTKQIAAACNRPYTTVKKWPLQRRERLAALIELGGCPQVADLLADVQRLCYELSIKLGLSVKLDTYIADVAEGSFYSVYYYDSEIEYRTNIADHAPLNAGELQTTINKLEEMIND